MNYTNKEYLLTLIQNATGNIETKIVIKVIKTKKKSCLIEANVYDKNGIILIEFGRYRLKNGDSLNVDGLPFSFQLQ